MKRVRKSVGGVDRKTEEKRQKKRVGKSAQLFWNCFSKRHFITYEFGFYFLLLACLLTLNSQSNVYHLLNNKLARLNDNNNNVSNGNWTGNIYYHQQKINKQTNERPNARAVQSERVETKKFTQSTLCCIVCEWARTKKVSILFTTM